MSAFQFPCIGLRICTEVLCSQGPLPRLIWSFRENKTPVLHQFESRTWKDESQNGSRATTYLPWQTISEEIWHTSTWAWNTSNDYSSTIVVTPKCLRSLRSFSTRLQKVGQTTDGTHTKNRGSPLPCTKVCLAFQPLPFTLYAQFWVWHRQQSEPRGKWTGITMKLWEV